MPEAKKDPTPFGFAATIRNDVRYFCAKDDLTRAMWESDGGFVFADCLGALKSRVRPSFVKERAEQMSRFLNVDVL